MKARALIAYYCVGSTRARLKRAKTNTIFNNW